MTVRRDSHNLYAALSVNRSMLCALREVSGMAVSVPYNVPKALSTVSRMSGSPFF